MSKISRVEGHILGNKEGPATWASVMLLVKVETSDGLVGYGEAVPTLRAEPMLHTIEEIGRIYTGLDPSEVERNRVEWEKNDFYMHSSFESTSAYSAVDIALWDLIGKSLGAPVHRLMGGLYRERIPVYANGWYSDCRTPDDFAKKADMTVKMGYRALKFDPFGGYYDRIDKNGLKASSEIVRAVRESVGNGVELMIEHHGRFNSKSAIMIADEIGQYDPLFMEEPVHPNDLMGLRNYRNRADVRIALGERIISKEQAMEYLYEGLVDILQPDICNIGGFTEIRKVSALTEAFGITLAPHNAFGPIQNAATIQFDASIPNLEIQESFYDFFPGWKRELVGNGTPVIDGYYQVNKGPGLGIDVKDGMIKEYEFKGMEEWNPDEPVWVVRGTWDKAPV
ncbi:MAG: mandelate racemase/muconate lactonizing enzyme family protein [Nitrososphaerota archaeon]|nr:mandelate racemase/muconate lactonizing enzyme family protein [Nitrososphaerota archaeon]MDG7048047.1 mandelate racemase/muconate lactonizing enzyme family protein [Nitrososphaerota archaeon]